MRKAVLLRRFPGLAEGQFEITSEATGRYNCFAWALEVTDRMYLPDPFPEGLYLWPPGVPRSDTLEGWLRAFEALGFAECPDASLEADHEKVAIFARPGGPPSHVARQLDWGKWTSKLGTMEDIEHDLDGLVGERYGHVARLLKRPRRL